MKKIHLLVGTLILAALILAPTSSIRGAQDGVDLCMEVIIPSLFPFFVCSRLLISLGFIEIFEQLTQKIMRPLFNVPGAGSFAFCLGILSGYPVGAKITCDLFDNNLCTKEEAERLLTFCNNSGPLFVIGTIGIGLYHSAQIGVMLYICHVLSAITVGILFRFYRLNKNTSPTRAGLSLRSRPQSQLKSLGEAFSDAVRESVTLIGVVCGFIIFFSSMLTVLQNAVITTFLAKIISSVGIDSVAAEGLSLGIFEITNGVRTLASSGGHLELCSFIIAWSGISVLLQVSGIIKSKLSIRVFVVAKLFQGAAAALYMRAALFFAGSASVFAQNKSPAYSPSPENMWAYSIILLLAGVALILTLGSLCASSEN